MAQTKRAFTGRSSEFSDEGGSSPLIAKGDIFTFTTEDARLPVGEDGLLLYADSATPTGLAWSSSSGDIDIKGKFLNNAGADGVGFVVDRYSRGRQSGFEWWEDGDALWAAGLDSQSTDLVLVCDIQTTPGQVHDLIRIKQGGAIKVTYGVNAVPSLDYRLHLLGDSTYDDVATKTMLRIDCVGGGPINIPIYTKNLSLNHMAIMENLDGKIYRFGIESPMGNVDFFSLGTCLSDGTGGNPDMFRFRSDGRIITTGSLGGLISTGPGGIAIGTDIGAFFAEFHGPSYVDGASKFQLALTSTDAYNSSSRGGGFWVSGEYDSAHHTAGFGGVSVYKENTTDGDLATVIALCNRPNDGGAAISERLRITGAGYLTCPIVRLGFFSAAAVVQQTADAVTNSVTAGGVNGTINDVTIGVSINAADGVTTRNAVYQLARSVAQLATLVRNYGLAA